MPIRSVPGFASVATPEGGMLYAPSAARNLEPLCDLLEDIAPPSGRALEIASGTGQHVIAYAARLPGLIWQPSEVDATRRTSIDAHASDTALDNIRPALELDATAPGWAQSVEPVDFIVLSNLLHLITEDDAKTLIREAARALKPSGKLCIYGPFMRAEELTSEGDRAFHASLIAHDPEIGYKDDFDTIDWLQNAGLDMSDVIEMPANNLALVAQKPDF
ncbi:DUF938 domain-containing protein [Phaeobacter sp. QD34_3]|uniref:DUF938 domain-containing protein n=1 Tax=unclassified Phaeobacter TaxID=2621772 RepID=UPI00237FABC7|nr:MULTISPECIES: DUF938 domain-containing protein [unclassified Phaeobacter]MDE4133792.1 DUF938 domain-containing protein [Phaeobacter sp. QD34_3]MDE4137516.1 DUF938 domain-containing protein [Phaeobacter sp. QD34_24]